MKIKFLTMHAAHNYGAVLQTYGLQKYLQNIGADVEIINYVSTQRRLNKYLFKISKKYNKSIIHKMVFLGANLPPRLINHYVFSNFVKNKLNVSSQLYTNNNEIASNCPDADIYCVGSDQVWNPSCNDGVDRGFLLDFVPENKRKISYSSSFGVNNLDENSESEMKELLKSFDYVSTRETSGINILKKMNIDNCECVLDPSFLLDSKQWDQFAEALNNKLPKKYLLIYYFGNTKQIMETATKIAKEKQLRIVRISVAFDKYEGDDIVLRFISPEQFIKVFSDADYVVTNSFHGVAFSINYNKQFLVYPTTENNPRFDSILNMCNLQDRNLRKINYRYDMKEIDYSYVNKVIEEQRCKSYDYLNRAVYGK